MRKFIVTILSVLCLACLGLAAAACAGSKYYTLTYSAIKGVTFDFGEIQSGAKVKEGYEVKFTCAVDENRVTGDPVVLINGEDEYPDLDGVYSFKMSRNTEVSVSGVYAINAFDVTFDKEQWRIAYRDAETGKELTSIEDVVSGTRVSFTLDVSVYYDRNSKFDVLANTTVVTPVDGVYTFTVTRKTTVKVTGLTLEEPFLNRPNGGKGIKKDPYLIERPIDLYVMADYVNSSFYNGRYAMAYYKLNADIDMEGEQLFIIGDTTTSVATFCGDFNGNGHKIYNYYISDTIIEQAEFTKVFMPYIGLFGMASATTAGPARIYDLTLENFTININANVYNSTVAAGGVVGAGIGVEVENCHVNGSITMDADDIYYGHMGGVVGFLQSAYNSDTQRAVSSVVGCTSEVDLEGQSGYVYSAGGIVGYVYAMKENTASYIANSRSYGTVAGAMRAGGIAGTMSPFSSVKNCYSLGEVNAYNDITPVQGLTQHAYAYAGGIAGYVERDSIVSGCFSLSAVHASAYGGSNYEVAGKICGGLNAGGGENIESSPALQLNCTDDLNNINEEYLTGELGWNEDEWLFGNVGNGYPEYIGRKGEKTVNVNIKYVINGVVVGAPVEKTLSAEAYRPISDWYKNGLDEFVTNSTGDRSYGYYFDEARTQKVPRGYVLTGAEELYCGFADYSEVSGVYYLRTQEQGSGAYIQLNNDGTLFYRNNGLNLTTSYIYDGKELTLYSCPAFTETEISNNADGSQTTNRYYTCGKGKLNGNVLELVNNVSYKESAPLRAVKEAEGFLYGEYYSTNNNECVFNTDGTGTFNGAPIDIFTVTGNTVTINGIITGTINAAARTITINGTVYTAYDPFKGTWEKSATTHVEFTFDGKSEWVYTYYSYIDGVKTVLQRDSGTYMFDGTDTLTLNGGSIIANNTLASMDENGFIRLQATDLTFYKPNSFTGKWRYFYKNEAIELTLNGVGKDGYGTGSIYYETILSDVDITYHVQNVQGVDYIYLFLEDTVMGILHYDVNDFTLKGMIYSYAEDEMLNVHNVYDLEGKVIATYPDIVSFCLYDDFGGLWVTPEWGIIEFNGYGSYNLKSIVIKEENNSNLTLAVSGSVRMDEGVGTYRLDNSTMTGSLVYDGSTYQIAYNANDDSITVQGGVTFRIYRPDSLRGIQLKGADGKTYAFDGASKLAGGGNVTVSDGSSSSNHKYTISGSTISIAGVGAITVSGEKYLLGGLPLTVANNFTGEWLVGGTLDALEIGEIGASNTAQGKYLGESVTFSYNIAVDRNMGSDYLSFEYKNRTYYIFAMLVTDAETSQIIGYELTISTSVNMLEGTSVNCIGKDVATDGFRGTYTAADGSSIMLDGLSSAVYSNGTIVLKDGNGATEGYSYSVNSFGMPVYTAGTDDDGKILRYVLTAAAADEEGAYTGNGKSFKAVRTDILYMRTATDIFGDKYTFNGIGTVVCGNKEYGYVIDKQDEYNLVFKLTLTDGAGKQYKAEFDYGSTNYEFRFTDELTGITVTEGKVEYRFVRAGCLTRTDNSAEDAVTVNYTYVIDSYDKNTKTYVLSATDADGQPYVVMLDISNEEEYKLTIAKKTA